MEDRAQKEKAKKAAEKAQLEIRCATKVSDKCLIFFLSQAFHTLVTLFSMVNGTHQNQI